MTANQETDADREERLNAQIEMIRDLLPALPAPVLSDDLAHVVNQVRDEVAAAERSRSPRLLRRALDVHEWFVQALDELASSLCQIPVPSSGHVPTAGAPLQHQHRETPYTIALRWDAVKVRVQWSTSADAAPPELILFESPDGDFMALGALTGAPSGTAGFSAMELGFSPTEKPWRIRLLALL
jgi:hypothetical protein